MNRTRSRLLASFGLILIVFILTMGTAAATVETIQSVGSSPYEGTLHTDRPNPTSISSSLDAGLETATITYHSFVSFDLSSIPEGATITAATLRMYQRSTQSFGDKILHFRNVDFGTLDASDEFLSGPLIGTSTNETWNTWIVFSVDPALVDLSKDYFQVRVSFESEYDTGFPMASFHTMFTYPYSYQYPPELVVEYEVYDTTYSPFFSMPLSKRAYEETSAYWNCILAQLPEDATCYDDLINDIQSQVQSVAYVSNPMHIIGAMQNALALMEELASLLPCGCSQMN